MFKKNMVTLQKNGWIAHAKEFYGLPVNKTHNREGDRNGVVNFFAIPQTF